MEENNKPIEAAGSVPTPAPASNTQPQPTQVSTEPAQVGAATAVQQTAAPAKPAPIPLTPEQIKAKKAETIKRLGIVCGGLYFAALAFVYIWAFAAGGKELNFFQYMGLEQEQFDGFVMTLLHVLYGILVFGALMSSLLFFFKSLMAKKEDVEKKKSASKKAMLSGIGFLFIAVAWLVSIIFLGPKLVHEESYTGILTDPENTIGLTAPIEITFDATSLPIDTDTVQILSYTWNFGDGSTGNGDMVTHKYTQKGSVDGRYTVTLTVDMADLKTGEQFDQQFTSEIVIVNEKVAASFVATPEDGEIPLDVTFDASSSYDPDGEIVSYEWDLNGDGRYDDAEGDIVEYTYEQEGNFEVSLRVTDNNGEYDVTTTTIEAGTVNGLRAIITADLAEGSTYFIEEKYTFSGELSRIDEGDIKKYTWDFGDGSKEVQSKSTTHTFEKAGEYTVTLTIQDSDANQDESTLEVTVVDQGTAPTAKVTTVPKSSGDTVTGPVPLDVSFDASVSTDPDDDIIQYEWDFENDGEIDDYGDTAEYTYEEEGTFEARLTLTDSGGNEVEKIINVVVTEQGIVAKITADVNNGEVPLTVSFDSSASTYKEGEIVSYEYDFGDGSDSYINGSEVTYKYSSVGNFTVSVTVIGADGKTDTTSTQIVVRPVSLTACFTVNTDSGSTPLFVAVDPSCSKGTIKEYRWNFGDGDLSFDRKPETHTYTSKGIYTISLEVTGGNGVVDTFEKEITVDE